MKWKQSRALDYFGAIAPAIVLFMAATWVLFVIFPFFGMEIYELPASQLKPEIPEVPRQYDKLVNPGIAIIVQINLILTVVILPVVILMGASLVEYFRTRRPWVRISLITGSIYYGYIYVAGLLYLNKLVYPRDIMWVVQSIAAD